MKLDIVCKKHPKYNAILRPRADCDACFILYFLTTGDYGTREVGIEIVGLTRASSILKVKE